MLKTNECDNVLLCIINICETPFKPYELVRGQGVAYPQGDCLCNALMSCVSSVCFVRVCV